MRTQQAAIAARYRRCAAQETAGVSLLYAAPAEAEHWPTLAFLAGLPVDKHQPNLLFAAFRWLAGLKARPTSFRAPFLTNSLPP